MHNMGYLKWAAMASLLPLGMAIYSYRRRDAPKESTAELVKYNVVCYVLSIIMLDACYMIALLGGYTL